MKILIVPMAAMAETHGPISRCRALAYGCKDAGLGVATCMAKDMNYREMDEIPNHPLAVPMPLGLPKAIATKVFPLAQRLGITSRKTVSSFDQVLRLTGNLARAYLVSQWIIRILQRSISAKPRRRSFIHGKWPKMLLFSERSSPKQAA